MTYRVKGVVLPMAVVTGLDVHQDVKAVSAAVPLWSVVGRLIRPLSFEQLLQQMLDD